MKTEREKFDLWFKNNFPDLNQAICCGDLVAKNYNKAMFKAWTASVNRKGYKLVPVEPTKAMLIAAEDCVIDSKVTANNIYKSMIRASTPLI